MSVSGLHMRTASAMRCAVGRSVLEPSSWTNSAAMMTGVQLTDRSVCALQDSLAGNSKTTLIVALSPHISNHEETVATLKFAERCKLLKNTVKKSVNRTAAELNSLVKSLTLELERLKSYVGQLEQVIKAGGLGLPDGTAGEGEQQYWPFSAAASLLCLLLLLCPLLPHRCRTAAAISIAAAVCLVSQPPSALSQVHLKVSKSKKGKHGVGMWLLSARS